MKILLEIKPPSKRITFCYASFLDKTSFTNMKRCLRQKSLKLNEIFKLSSLFNKMGKSIHGTKFIIHKLRGEQFFMEQKLRFGLVLDLLAILKKNCADYEQLLRAVFFMFSWAKIYIYFFNIVASALKSCIK